MIFRCPVTKATCKIKYEFIKYWSIFDPLKLLLHEEYHDTLHITHERFIYGNQFNYLSR